MTYPHVIRLGEPWQRLAQGGSVRFERSFHCPTGLTDETVWLVLENCSPAASVKLNGQALSEVSGPGGFGEFEITTMLAPRNAIQIDVPADAAQLAGQGLGPVRLEIRTRAATS